MAVKNVASPGPRARAKLVLLGSILAATAILLGIVEARFDPTKHREIIERISAEVGVDPRLVEAVVAAESSHRPGVVSDKGAVGLMQLLPDTASEVGGWLGIGEVDPRKLRDPEFNLRIGIEYLSWLLRTYRSVELALAAYNAGPGRVDRWRAENPDLPPARLIEEAAFPETRAFVARVLRRYRR